MTCDGEVSQLESLIGDYVCNIAYDLIDEEISCPIGFMPSLFSLLPIKYKFMEIKCWTLPIWQSFQFSIETNTRYCND